MRTLILIIFNRGRADHICHPCDRAGPWDFGAGNETRTRDPNLGKVMLYQLSYSRYIVILTYNAMKSLSRCKLNCARMASPRGVEPLLPG